MNAVDHNNVVIFDDIQIDGMALADGTEVLLDLVKANYLNSNGIITALNLTGSFVSWGNETACYPANTDVTDYFYCVSRMFSWVANSVRQHNIDLRAAQQQKDTVKGTTEVVSVKHILVVTPKKLNPGKVATAAAAEVSGEYAVSYYATYIDGKKKLEIDPLNYIYYVNGKDYLADVRKALGK